MSDTKPTIETVFERMQDSRSEFQQSRNEAQQFRNEILAKMRQMTKAIGVMQQQDIYKLRVAQQSIEDRLDRLEMSSAPTGKI